MEARQKSLLSWYCFLHAAISCVNVCIKVIHQSPEEIAVPLYHTTLSKKKKNPWMWLCQNSPVNLHKPPRALSHFNWANHRRWLGQRAPLDALQLPMGNVSPSHRRGITNSLLSVLTSDGGCSKLTAPHLVHRELCMTRERIAPCYLRNLSYLVLEEILTRVSYIFHHISQGLQSVPTSRVINRKGVTLFTFSLKAEHRLIIYVTVHQQRDEDFYFYFIQHFTF